MRLKFLTLHGNNNIFMSPLFYRIHNQFRRKRLLKHSRCILHLLKKILQDSAILLHLSDSPNCMKILFSAESPYCMKNLSSTSKSCSASQEKIVKKCFKSIDVLSLIVFMSAIRCMLNNDLETIFSILLTISTSLDLFGNACEC